MSSISTVFNKKAIGTAGMIGCGVIGAATLINSVWIAFDSGTPQPMLAFNGLYLLGMSALLSRARHHLAKPDSNTPS